MPETTALLIIDVQKSFLSRPFWVEEETIDFRKSLLRLIEGSVAADIPVVAIYHANTTVEGSPFHPQTGLVSALNWLDYQPSVTFQKSAHNAFTDTGLDRWLRLRGITRLIISGIRTEQCCETTARVASDLGYEVDFVTEATQTFAMTGKSGRILTAAEIKERTEIVLEGRFARIIDVDGVLASFKRDHA